MKDKREKRGMRLETERNIYYCMICIGFPLMLYGIITSYIDGLYSLWMTILIIIILIIFHIISFIYLRRYFKKKIEIRRSRGYMGRRN